MTTIIDSTGVRERAAADVGRPFNPGGLCLEHNAIWALQGVTSPFGLAGKVATVAMDAWNWSEHKVVDGSAPFDGAWCFFGASPTRTDANKAAGDVCTYDASTGKVIATDANGNVVGRMTIEQRAAQTQRPYLGHTGDYLGALASAYAAANASTPSTPAVVPADIAPKENQVLEIISTPIPNSTGHYNWLWNPDPAHMQGGLKNLNSKQLAFFTSRAKQDPASYNLVDGPQNASVLDGWTYLASDGTYRPHP
jgi:hypothetical protein